MKYKLYKGNTFLTEGTIKEISRKEHVSIDYLRKISNPSVEDKRKRANVYRMVKVEEISVQKPKPKPKPKTKFDLLYDRVKMCLDTYGNTFVSKDLERVIERLKADGIEVSVRKSKLLKDDSRAYVINSNDYLPTPHKRKYETIYIIEVIR